MSHFVISSVSLCNTCHTFNNFFSHFVIIILKLFWNNFGLSHFVICFSKKTQKEKVISNKNCYYKFLNSIQILGEIWSRFSWNLVHTNSNLLKLLEVFTFSPLFVLVITCLGGWFGINCPHAFWKFWNCSSKTRAISKFLYWNYYLSTAGNYKSASRELQNNSVNGAMLIKCWLLNLMVMLTFSILYWKYPFSVNLVQNVKIVFDVWHED